MPGQPGNTMSPPCVLRGLHWQMKVQNPTRDHVEMFKVSMERHKALTCMAFHNIKSCMWCCHGSSTWALSPVVYTSCPYWCQMIRITIKLTPSKFVMCKSGGGIICYTGIADYRQEAYTWIILKGAMPISWVFLLYFNWAAHHFNFTTSLVFSSLYSGLPTEFFHLQMDLPTFPC